MIKTDWQAEDRREIASANAEIQEGRKFIFWPSAIPAGRIVKFFYLGVPGIWAVDEKGDHWCASPKDYRFITVDKKQHVHDQCVKDCLEFLG